MKTRALVGFTWVDAFSWLATEARADGLAVMIGADQKKAWIGGDLYIIAKDEDEIPIGGVDEIITRQSMEGAA